MHEKNFLSSWFKPLYIALPEQSGMTRLVGINAAHSGNMAHNLHLALGHQPLGLGRL
jgi:hypothetical protein